MAKRSQSEVSTTTSVTSKRVIKGVLLGVLLLLFSPFIFGTGMFVYVGITERNNDKNNPARIESLKIEPFIEKNKYTILHTYNRAYYSLNAVSPNGQSFEYYIESQDTVDETKSKFEDYMQLLGYSTRAITYKYGDIYKCESEQKTDTDYCSLPKIDRRLFYSNSQNDNRAYPIVAGKNSSFTFDAIVTGETFEAHANDSFHGTHEVRPGYSVLVLTIKQRDKEFEKQQLDYYVDD